MGESVSPSKKKAKKKKTKKIVEESSPVEVSDIKIEDNTD